MKTSDSRVHELAVALQNAEQKLADRQALLGAASAQTEAARFEAQQAIERLEALQRQLDAKEDQLRALQRELRQRDERISQLEQLCAENAGAHNPANPSERVAAMGLLLESLDEPGVVHRINRITTTIGRSIGNDIVLHSTSASRYHARVVIASDSTYLIDLQSTNGCMVNGERISRQMINDGDVIAIGDVNFRFSISAPLPEVEDRSMDETHTLLDDSVIFTPAPSRIDSPRERSLQSSNPSAR